MAQSNTLNPFPSIGNNMATGLNSIIEQLPSVAQESDLVNAVTAYIQSTFYENATESVGIEISSVAYNVINSIRNNLVESGLAGYNAFQWVFIQAMIGDQMIPLLAPDSFSDRVADIEDNVGTTGLTINEQTPLFLATTTGSNANVYWQQQLGLGSASPWTKYFSANAGQNYMNTIQWSTAAMNGALAGYGANPDSLIEPTINKVTNKMVSALTGALTATAGKLIFNLIPRISKPLFLNRQDIASLQVNSNPGGPIGPINPPAILNSQFSLWHCSHNQWCCCSNTNTYLS